MASVSDLEKYVVALINDAAKQNGFTEYTVQISSGSNKGDGLIGIILRLHLTGLQEINGISKQAKVSVICKLPSAKLDDKIAYHQSFQSEIHAYTEILPEFVKFQNEKGISEDEGFFNFPKIYAVYLNNENKNCGLIMEDMKSNGYEFKIVSSVDMEHAKLFMESLGKFHAISFALRDQKPDILKKYQNISDFFLMYLQNCKRQETESMLEISLKKSFRIWNPQDERIAKKMQNYSENLLEIISSCVDGMASEPFSVISHGDCKSNNLCFLYNEKRIPQQICIFDWQCIRYSSPVLDIIYFLFSETDKKFRDDHYEELLQIYHKSLANFLTKLGSDADRLFSYKNLKDQLQKFGKFGIFTAPVLIQFATTDSGLEYDEIVRKNENENDQVDDVDLYTKNVIDVFNDGLRLGYI